MARPAKPARPAPIRLEGLSVTVVRGPDDAGRWYWRARRGEATLWAGWATREEAAAAGARLTLGQPAAGASECKTVRDLLELWFGEQEGRVETGQLAASSLGTMRAVVRALLRELGPILVGAVSIQTLERYRDARRRHRRHSFFNHGAAARAMEGQEAQ